MSEKSSKNLKNSANSRKISLIIFAVAIIFSAFSLIFTDIFLLKICAMILLIPSSVFFGAILAQNILQKNSREKSQKSDENSRNNSTKKEKK